MITPKLKQLVFESDTWKRTLTFMAEENIHLKNRLSEIVREKIDKALLPQAEEFNNRFLKHDNLIKVLRNDISDYDRLLARELFEDGAIIDAVELKQRTIRKNIREAEERFGSLKLDFYTHMPVSA